jgi:hypothetical protein
MLQMELEAFIESVIASGKSDKKWFDFKKKNKMTTIKGPAVF